MEKIVRIIEGCRQGDPKYQHQLFERYKGFALKTVFRYVYRYEKAIDVMHDGFVKVFRHFNRFDLEMADDPEKLLMGWMKRIFVHAAIDELRRGNMLPEIGGIPDYAWELPDKAQEADQLLLYKDLMILVKELPPSYRAVFNLHVIDGYNHYEIADVLNIAPGTSKSCLSRARQLLQQRIKKMEAPAICRI